jgi:non-heme chloroperoxidase
MLIIGGEKDHQVPWAIANATYKEQSENPASPKSLRSPTAGTRSPSTADGRK